MITGVGFGPNRSVEVVQAIIEHRELTPVFPPAALTMLGPDPDFDGGSSGAKAYTGNDCDGSGIPGLHVAVIGTIGAAAEGAVESNVPASSSLYTSGSDVGDATSWTTEPDETLLPGALDPTGRTALPARIWP